MRAAGDGPAPRLGLIGLGAIGRELVARLGPEGIACTVLTRTVPADLPGGLRRVGTLDALLADRPGLIVECAGHDALRACAVPVLNAGMPLLVASVGALADAALADQITAASARTGARVLLPAGAIGGLDLLRAVAAAGDPEVSYRGTKPPAAWKGTPAEDRAALDSLSAPVPVFEGSGREAALAFPRNANVVAALALAGAGFDSLRVTLIADPAATGNTHAYSVRSPLCSYDMTIRNAPTQGNARSSLTTVLSLAQEIRDFLQP